MPEIVRHVLAPEHPDLRQDVIGQPVHVRRPPRTPSASARTSARTASTRPGLAFPSRIQVQCQAIDDRRADHRRVGGVRHLGGLRRGLDAEPDRDRQIGEPAQPRHRLMHARRLGRARAGDAGDRDVIDEAAGMRDDRRQAGLVAGRGREADDVETGGARRPGQLGILLGRQIDDDRAIDPGRHRVAREGIGAVAVDRVVIAHQHIGRVRVALAQACAPSPASCAGSCRASARVGRRPGSTGRRPSGRKTACRSRSGRRRLRRGPRTARARSRGRDRRP